MISLRSLWGALLLIGAFASQSSAQTDPTLPETLKWLKDKLTSAGTFPLGAGLGKTFEPIRFDSCTIQWKGSIMSPYSPPTSSITTLELSKLDATKVTLEPLKLKETYNLRFETLDGNASIRTQLLDRRGDGGEITGFAKYLIEIKGEDDGKRIVRALSHAITLCVGQKEPF